MPYIPRLTRIEDCPKELYKLTKREQFAMSAMQGLISDSNVVGAPHDIATAAVRCADALLAALEKPVE